LADRSGLGWPLRQRSRDGRRGGGEGGENGPERRGLDIDLLALPVFVSRLDTGCLGARDELRINHLLMISCPPPGRQP
jgi:hypothetical protein